MHCFVGVHPRTALSLFALFLCLPYARSSFICGPFVTYFAFRCFVHSPLQHDSIRCTCIFFDGILRCRVHCSNLYVHWVHEYMQSQVQIMYRSFAIKFEPYCTVVMLGTCSLIHTFYQLLDRYFTSNTEGSIIFQYMNPGFQLFLIWRFYLFVSCSNWWFKNENWSFMNLTNWRFKGEKSSRFLLKTASFRTWLEPRESLLITLIRVDSRRTNRLELKFNFMNPVWSGCSRAYELHPS